VELLALGVPVLIMVFLVAMERLEARVLPDRAPAGGHRSGVGVRVEVDEPAPALTHPSARRSDGARRGRALARSRPAPLARNG
jgi:hypothetical protein